MRELSWFRVFATVLAAGGLTMSASCGDGEEGSSAIALAGSPGGPGDPSNAVFDETVFATYTLTLDAADWDRIVNEPSNDTWRRGTMTWQGETVADVGIRPSGVTTRIPGNRKPSLRVDFNAFVPGRKWRLLGQLRFDAFIRDKSFLRDRLSYWTYREVGAVASRFAHARLYVNGNYNGVYGVEEPVRKELAKRAWGEDDGNLYEVKHVESSAPDPYRWTGSQVSDYVPFPFEPKTNEVGGDHRDVLTLIETLANVPIAERRAALDARIVDVDAFLRYLAVLQSLADYDGITASWGANNHYWYRPSASSRLVMIPWDPEFSLGLFGQSSERSLWEGMDRTVMASWVRSDAAGAAAFKAKVRGVLDGPFADMSERLDFIVEQIRQAVYDDPVKHATNAQFDSGVAAVKAWVGRRITSLEFQLTQ